MNGAFLTLGVLCLITLVLILDAVQHPPRWRR